MIRSSIILAAILLLGIAIYLLGMGKIGDNRFADAFMKWRGVRQADRNVVLLRIDEMALMEFGPLPWSPETVARVFEAVKRMKPKKVVLAGNPSQIIADPEAFKHPWVLRISPSSKETAAKEKAPLLQLTFPDKDGVVRRLYANHPDREIRGVAWEFGMLEREAIEGSFLVNFVGPPSSIANLSVADITAGSAPEDFLKNKYVIIGLDILDIARYVVVPTTDYRKPMAEAEFHAHALTTLLENSAFRYLAIWQIALLFAFTMLLHWIIMLPTTIRKNLLLTTGFLALVFVTSLAALRYSSVFPPVSGLAFVIVMTFLASSERKVRMIQVHTGRISKASRWELTLRPVHTDIRNMDEKELWEQIVRFASLHLRPESMLFARSAPGNGRIRFVRAYNTEESKVRELRRDLSRTPYSTMIANSSVEIVNRYMHDESLTSFLVPLFYPSRFMGLWVVNFKYDAQPVKGRLALLLQIGQQIARHLYYSDIDGAGDSLKKRLIPDIDRIERQLQDIDRIFSNLMEEKNIFRSVMDCVHEGVAFTDMFGRLLFLNQPMREIILGCGIKVEELNTLSDLLRKFGLVSEEGEPAWLLKFHLESEERVFMSQGHRFIISVMHREVEDGVSLPEGFILTANIEGVNLNLGDVSDDSSATRENNT